MKRCNLISGLLTLLVCSFFSIPGMGQEDKVDFVSQIQPIFENHCLKCHVGDDAEAFELDDVDATMEYIEAGDAENSTLYEYLIIDDEDLLMPPADEGIPLSDEQILLIKTWINEGAEWPDDAKLVLPKETSDVAPAQDDTKDQDATVPEKEKENGKTLNQTIVNAIGSLHPAVLHIPMGLLLAAGLFALLGIRGNFVMSDCAYYCMWLGVLGAIVACITGWWFSPMENKGDVASLADLMDQKQPVFWHRTSAIIVTVLGLVIALFAASARAKDPDDGAFWKVGLIALAIGVAFVGQQGGKLTWKKNHYEDLNNLINQFAPGVFGEPVEDPAAKGDDDSDANAKEDGDEQAGKSSDETDED